MLLKNSSKSKCLCESYKPKIWVSSEEVEYCSLSVSQWITKDLSDFSLCMGTLCSRALILHKDVYKG